MLVTLKKEALFDSETLTAERMLDELTNITENIRRGRYAKAPVVFLAGSLVRGEGTSTSDLDLVVVFDRLPNAFRESFWHEKWPVEAFVHDPSTLEHFFRTIDRPTGFPSLAAMVSEGIEVPAVSEFSNRLKQLANKTLDEGPPKSNEDEIKNSRYQITDLIEDMRDPRSPHKLHATASSLYPALANHFFRSRGLWSAKGKTIPRRLSQIDQRLANQFVDGFSAVFAKNCSRAVILLAEEILAPEGGFLFAGYKLEASKLWRVE